MIIPARDESYRVLSATVGCLINQTHPRVQAVMAIGYDDPETLAVARQLIEEDRTGRLSLAVSHSDVHNKPTQLNAALKVCTARSSASWMPSHSVPRTCSPRSTPPSRAAPRWCRAA